MLSQAAKLAPVGPLRNASGGGAACGWAYPVFTVPIGRSSSMGKPESAFPAPRGRFGSEKVQLEFCYPDLCKLVSRSYALPSSHEPW